MRATSARFLHDMVAALRSWSEGDGATDLETAVTVLDVSDAEDDLTGDHAPLSEEEARTLARLLAAARSHLEGKGDEATLRATFEAADPSVLQDKLAPLAGEAVLPEAAQQATPSIRLDTVPSALDWQTFRSIDPEQRAEIDSVYVGAGHAIEAFRDKPSFGRMRALEAARLRRQGIGLHRMERAVKAARGETPDAAETERYRDRERDYVRENYSRIAGRPDPVSVDAWSESLDGFSDEYARERVLSLRGAVNAALDAAVRETFVPEPEAEVPDRLPWRPFADDDDVRAIARELAHRSGLTVNLQLPASLHAERRRDLRTFLACGEVLSPLLRAQGSTRAWIAPAGEGGAGHAMVTLCEAARDGDRLRIRAHRLTGTELAHDRETLSRALTLETGRTVAFTLPNSPDSHAPAINALLSPEVLRSLQGGRRGRHAVRAGSGPVVTVAVRPTGRDHLSVRVEAHRPHDILLSVADLAERQTIVMSHLDEAKTLRLAAGVLDRHRPELERGTLRDLQAVQRSLNKAWKETRTGRPDGPVGHDADEPLPAETPRYMDVERFRSLPPGIRDALAGRRIAWVEPGRGVLADFHAHGLKKVLAETVMSDRFVRQLVRPLDHETAPRIAHALGRRTLDPRFLAGFHPTEAEARNPVIVVGRLTDALGRDAFLDGLNHPPKARDEVRALLLATVRAPEFHARFVARCIPPRPELRAEHLRRHLDERADDRLFNQRLARDAHVLAVAPTEAEARVYHEAAVAAANPVPVEERIASATARAIAQADLGALFRRREHAVLARGAVRLVIPAEALRRAATAGDGPIEVREREGRLLVERSGNTFFEARLPPEAHSRRPTLNAPRGEHTLRLKADPGRVMTRLDAAEVQSLTRGVALYIREGRVELCVIEPEAASKRDMEKVARHFRHADANASRG